MEHFCGSSFWDLNAMWYASNPDFSQCFEDTALLWPVCGFLWVAAIFDVYFILTPSSHRVIDLPTWLPAWTKLGIAKIFILATLVFLQVAMLCVNWVYNTKEVGVEGIPDVLWTTPIMLIITHILSANLIVFHKSHCVHTSGIQLIHSSLLSLAHLIMFRTSLLKFEQTEHGTSLGSLILLGIVTSLMIIQSILFCWSDIPSAEPRGHTQLIDSTLEQNESCPLSKASFLSTLFFSWLDPLVRKGFRYPLTLADLPNPLNSIKSLVAFKIFMNTFGKPRFSETRGIFSNIIKPIFATCWLSFLIGLLYHSVAVSLTFFTPAVMGNLIDFVNDPSIPNWKGYLWATVIFLINIFSVILEEQCMLHFFICYLRVLPSLSMNIYRKALRITPEAKKEKTTGEVVNLMSVDLEQIRVLVFDVNVMFAAVIQVTLGVILLWEQLGLAILPGLGILSILIPLNWFASWKMAKLQRSQMKKKDERIKSMCEVLSGMQVIKLYAWEPAYQKQIQDVRGEELSLTRSRYFYQTFMSFIFNSIPFLVSFGSFLAYIYLSDGTLDAKKTFVSLSLFALLTNSLEYVPFCIAEFVDVQVSFKRINDFLNAPEFHPDATKFEEKSDNDSSAVEISDGTFSWEEVDTSSFRLSDINLKIQPSTLTAIVGSVASGKSSLLSAILGDMKYSGGVIVRGRLSYVPQIAWILNATLRENICFGLDYEKSKYDRIIKACCLLSDLEMLPAGDMTEIGEKGINLSGGQKQRVSLARAVYSGADIFLLDDVLSAVDAHVGKHIFDKLLGPNGLLSGHTRILCTHVRNFLSQVDNIVVLEEGRIIEEGTYGELIDGGTSFSKLLSTQIQSKTNTSNNEAEKDASGVNSEKQEKKDKEDGKLIEDEHLETGDVKFSAFLEYGRALNLTMLMFLVIFFFTSEGLSLGRNIILAKWSDLSNSNQTLSNSVLHYVLEYASFGVSQAICCYMGYLLLTIASIQAAKLLHDKMLSRILHAPMSFFNTTPLGRITNRFSSDVEAVDNEIPSQFGWWLELVSRFFGIIAAITYTNRYFLVVILPLCVIYYFLQRYYVKCMQELQRLQTSNRSPIYAHFQESLAGTSSIRAYQAEERFIGKLGEKVDTYNMVHFPVLMMMRWLAVRLGMLGAVVVFIPAVFAVIFRSTTNPSLVGLAITYSTSMVSILGLLVKVTSYLQFGFVSVERILEYSEVDQEADYASGGGHFVKDTWPEKGEIIFKNYQTRYRPGLDLVLKNISCIIRPGEKIGIVGRTGAGKSSLTLALFRIIEAAGGSIFIDNVDIKNLGLSEVRRRLTVIPQDPVLFSRTLRLNIDPFEEFQDGQLWEALRLAHLKEFVEGQPEGLSFLVAEGGENLSVGQRQLVCLARATLRRSTILVLDEATASVDSVTDELIQTTIRENFSGCTILNVAHRLNTVLDSSRIMVLGQGEIIEFDSPQALLSDSNSHFYGMAQDAGLIS